MKYVVVLWAVCLVLLIAVILLWARSAHAAVQVQFENQVAEWMIPRQPIEAAARSWGVPISYGGPPGCLNSPPGVVVICITTIHPARDLYTGGNFPSRWYSEWTPLGIGLNPRLIHAPDWMIQEAACHEIGSALGHPEQPPGAHSCMARAMNGWVNP